MVRRIQPPAPRPAVPVPVVLAASGWAAKASAVAHDACVIMAR